MLQQIITSAVTALVLGSAALPALADRDGDVATAMLATLYGPSGAARGQDATQRFYATRDYLPVWWQDGAWTAEARAAVDALGEARVHGLSGERYGGTLLDGAVHQGFAMASGADAIAATELALTDALLTYLAERQAGLVDPTSVGWMTRTSEEADAARLLDEALDSGRLADRIAGLAPARPGYGALLAELQRYRALALEPWSMIASGPSIKAGMSDPRVPEVRAHLALLGDLEPLPPVAMEDVGEEVYHHDVVAAVERFQARHGLEADGIVGRRTLAQLNVSPAERVRTIVANLEKLRWMPPSEALGDRHIEVNVPGYELVAYEDGRPVLTMPVIVGEPAHPTPVFSDRIVNLKFAPNWTVPFKIARNELLPKIQQDPGWLIANNYKVISDWGRGHEIDPWSVDWTQVTPQTWSYMLQQQPGPASALGLIRFSLTNPQDIYLHDTGSRHLFARALRSLSHGCVRVGDPAELARYVLATEPEPWSRERVLDAMNAEETDYHRLAQAVPVDFFYVTAWVDAAGRTQFRSDIYGMDEKVLAALDEAAAEPVIELPLLIGAERDESGGDVAAIEPAVAEAPL